MEWLETEDCLEHPPVLIGRLRSRTGRVNEVHVLDVSLAGCLIERHGLALMVEDRVLIKLADLSFLPATVVWVEDQEAGLVFETELYEPVLERLKQSFERIRRY